MEWQTIHANNIQVLFTEKSGCKKQQYEVEIAIPFGGNMVDIAQIAAALTLVCG